MTDSQTCPDGLPLDPRPFAAEIGGPWKFRPQEGHCQDPDHYAEDDDEPSSPPGSLQGGDRP